MRALVTAAALASLLLLAACDSGLDAGARASSPPAPVAADAVHVSASAAPGGDGSRAHPFDSLQAVEQVSEPGDTIIVLASPPQVPPLDGGIALKPNQRLIGDGPDVVQHRAGTALPRLRNTGLLRLDGDAVRLAPGSEVRNLVITESVRGAIYGRNVPGVVIAGNDVSGYNTQCAIGFMVERFPAPTRAPFLGVPAVLPAGWAGIMVDADLGRGDVRITSNYVHDSACGNGIDLRISGSADYSAEISGNFVTQLKRGPGAFTGELHLVHAITTQVTDQARLVAHSVDNTQTYIGSAGADCEGLFMNLADSAYGRWTIDRNTFAHGIGGFSCNGMELIISNGNAHGEMTIRDSRFEDNPGDMLEQANLGSGSTLILELDRVTVRDTHERGGAPDAGPIPFNLGECLLTGSTGTGNTTVLRVRDSSFENCNNGLSLLSGGSIENGLGPDGLLDVEVTRSRFRNNAYDNLVLGVITPLRELRLKVEDSDFSVAGDTAVAFRRINLGRVEQAHIDLGGGDLGSAGRNCIHGGEMHDAVSEGLPVSLQGNWWGQAGGPRAERVAASQGGRLDTAAPLAAPPAGCAGR